MDHKREDVMSSRIKNINQARAKFAYEKVKEVTDWTNGDVEKKKEFKSHVKDIPMMIKTNGLAATYAFVFSKQQKKDYEAIMTITQGWLVEKQKLFELVDGQDFHKTLMSLDQYQYRLAAREIIALFTWLKRYADGLIQINEPKKILDA